MKIPYTEYFNINGQAVKNAYSYLKDNRLVLHTSVREDIHKELHKLAKTRKRPISKILDCIWMTFEAHPEIKKDFLKRLREY